MCFLRRSLCAPRRRSRRAEHLIVEVLEPRVVLSAAPIVAAGGGAAHVVVMRPAVENDTINPITSGARPSASGSSVPDGYTPQQVRSAYGINSIHFGTIGGDGAGQTIVIVDAFDDPALVDSSSPGFGASDLARFDEAFRLPDPPSFQKLNEYGNDTSLPGTDPAGTGGPQTDWALEEALDVEWAHAVAPGANIVLIETNSSNSSDMYAGAVTAAGLPGASVVSMSWGATEYAGEQSFDSDFTAPSGHQGVTFVASTGDGGSPGEYPAYSPNVVAAGGTTLSLNSDGSYQGESAWSSGGGGVSWYESEPAYQQAVQSSGKRSTPDIAFDADPSTGVAIYNSGDSAGPWQKVGGTSLAAPCFAGIIAIVNQGRVIAGATPLDGSDALRSLYAFPSTTYNDVTTGGNGGFTSRAGYDETTGMGTPKAELLVPSMAAYGIAGNLVVTAQPPANAIAGVAFGLSVKVENTDGTLETTYDGPLTVTLASNSGDGTIGGTVVLTAQNGIATFSNLTLDRAGSGYTLLVNAGGTAFATTIAFAVSPAAPARLVVITVPPVRTFAGAPFGLTVAIEDDFGNIQTTYGGSVTASLTGNARTTNLSGTRTVTANQGMAIFSALVLKKLGAGYSITLSTADGLATATTIRVSVLSGPRKLSRPQSRPVRVTAKHLARAAAPHASRSFTTARA